MPIKGISERRRYPRIGKVRIGEKAISSKGVEYPKATDHFIIDVKDDKMKAFADQKFGAEPKCLTIGFPFDDEPPFENAFPQYYKSYTKSKGLMCKGDGVTATMVREDGTMDEGKVCPCPMADSKECRMVATLSFVISGFPALGIWQLDTSSINNIEHINTVLEMIKKKAGTIKGIPIRMRLEEHRGQQGGKPTKYHLLALTPVDMMLGKVVAAIEPEDDIDMIGDGQDERRLAA